MKKKNIQNRLVAFIDILGFSQRVKNISTTKDLKDLYNDVDHVQREFEVVVKDKSEKEYRKMAGKDVLAFSDCLVISLGAETKWTDSEGSFETFLVEFEQIGLAQMHCIQKGIFIRGGIDIGWWYHDSHKVISSALATSYELEGKADVPVIALCKKIHDYLNGHPNKEAYKHDFDPLELLRKYHDKNMEFWFIDYLSICLRAQDFYEDREFVFEVHKKQIEKAYSKANTAKIKKKYRWLSKYHNEILAEHGSGFAKHKIVLKNQVQKG
ncbi:MAG: hypothetical protein RW306_12920 [Geobacteraceae bacterium]|nr:hypothetical protein [Geobacteraceae bacterium]